MDVWNFADIWEVVADNVRAALAVVLGATAAVEAPDQQRSSAGSGPSNRRVTVSVWCPRER